MEDSVESSYKQASFPEAMTVLADPVMALARLEPIDDLDSLLSYDSASDDDLSPRALEHKIKERYRVSSTSRVNFSKLTEPEKRQRFKHMQRKIQRLFVRVRALQIQNDLLRGELVRERGYIAHAGQKIFKVTKQKRKTHGERESKAKYGKVREEN